MVSLDLNIINLISKPPWNTEIDWDLHTTAQWEKYTPFRSHVQPRPLASSQSTQHQGQILSFPQFSELPLEIQLYVLTFCPAHVLFQMMHVSVSLRKEASKLFWSDPTTYLFISGTWLIHGGYSGDTDFNSGVFNYVQNIEIWCDSHTNHYLSNDFAYTYDTPPPEYYNYEESIPLLWPIFRFRFPNARRILVNAGGYQWFYKQSYPDFEPLRSLMKACPFDELYSRVSQHETFGPTDPLQDRSWSRFIYRRVKTGVWEKLTCDVYPNTVMMPLKRVHGPAAEYQRIGHEHWMGTLRKEAILPLMIDITARLKLGSGADDSFICPFPRCNVHVSNIVRWVVHASQQHRYRRYNLEMFPDELKPFLEKQFKHLSEMTKDLRRRHTKLIMEWNEAGSEEQESVKLSWMQNFERDDVWINGKHMRGSTAWENFLSNADLELADYMWSF